MALSKKIAVLVQRAEMDYGYMNLGLEHPGAADEPIGQLAQGVIEKLSRAILLTAGVKMGNDHDLSDYTDMLKAVGKKLPVDANFLETMTPFALRLRYETLSSLGMAPLDRKKLAKVMATFRDWALLEVEEWSKKSKTP